MAMPSNGFQGLLDLNGHGSWSMEKVALVSMTLARNYCKCRESHNFGLEIEKDCVALALI